MVFALVPLMSCSPPAARPAAANPDLGAWLVAEEPTPSAATVLVGDTRSTSSAPRPVRVLAARENDGPSRPRRRARIDVNFQGAEMASGFQLLAEAGRFNLVMQEGLRARLTATMHGVDPYDALRVLAEANGASVQYERDVVVVQKR